MAAWGSLVVFAATVSVLAAVAVTGYHVLLAVGALLPSRRLNPSVPCSRHRFAILIPAHNEEATLSRALQACKAVDYPADKFDVFVIADNCTDRTADVARQFDVECLERLDVDKKGKGFALRWALPRLLNRSYDAVFFLDADCAVDVAALQVLHRHLAMKHDVVQISNQPDNSDTSAFTYLASIANTLENHLFYRGKDRLGLAVMLRGTGFMLTPAVLQSVPWQASGKVEDVQYTLALLRKGMRVHFDSRVAVRSPWPASEQQLTVQRRRWVGGHFQLLRQEIMKLLADSVRLRKPILLDAAWTLVIVSRPIVMAILAAALACSALATIVTSGQYTQTLLLAALGCVVTMVAYALVGVWLLGITKQRARHLIAAPLAIARYLLVAVDGWRWRKQTNWTRTPRTDR